MYTRCALFVRESKGYAAWIITPNQHDFPYLSEDLVVQENLGYTFLLTL